ncbi:NifB/NifX family molybdenum-iron cluster-binding protein [Parafannyhessea umbonata]|uniref:UPF0251 protein SAMN04487824_12715 n=1 Tax=Parafannyhessea umbonata TaxID=604330 RepID=A0A1G6N0C9_9ACTN|nr:NifB/NifX family molybdenum-iron cluster-binding protein [Parafannyhessea umbonata]SDC61151.1 Predicted DNA-binding protein, UPF0251 family [Parafannyhessea umbonata]
MAGRKEKPRRVGIVPEYVSFSPGGLDAPRERRVQLTLDELEAIRLIDLEGLDQHQAAERMCVARATVAAVYARARHDIADALVNGKKIAIGGGSVTLAPLATRATPWPHKLEKNMTRIAVTHEDGNVFQHFGRTQSFKLYDVEDGKVVTSQVVGAGGVSHGALAGLLAENGVDVLICGGLGGGALAALQRAGVRVYGGAQGPADDAVASYLAGSMQQTDEASCDHHGHHEGGCGHGGCGH